MSGPKTEAEYKQEMSLEEAIDHAREVIESLRDGTFTVEADGRSVQLHPSGRRVRVKIEGEQKPHKEELSVKLQWSREENPSDGAGTPAPQR